ncbi:tigger transposable element-derived protein 4 [Rhipicephalus microplus]|uniref:tigger transposable element-derived protein 4 n=1 Tax=Rhipicephalus microplus TaxID=6941 RepID=UPI001888BF0D|nr:tigger transposable element-derived protein 4-like [Rhipicephalus microplus]
MEFGISKQTVSDFIKNKVKILKVAAKSTGDAKKNASQGVYPKLEESLVVWLSAMITKKILVSGDILKQKAEVSPLQMGVKVVKFNDGRLRNLKSRNDFKFKKMSGESGAIDDSVVAEYRDGKLQSLLQQFPPNDIFNCDKTRLFYRLLPQKTLAFAGDPCHGGKHSKERLTIVLGSNRSGSEKLPLLVIGKSKHPRCFKGAVTLPFFYEANKKVWVKQQLFEAYMRKLHRGFEQQNERVLLLVDNCAAHGPIKDLKAIQIEFLLPNTTAILQSMDQGMIQNFKHHYKSRMLSHMVLCSHNRISYTIDFRSAVDMLAES